MLCILLERKQMELMMVNFTDDSEMEIALLQGLINGKDDEFFPIEKIVRTVY